MGTYGNHLNVTLLESTLDSVEVVGIKVEFVVGLDDVVARALAALLDEGGVLLLAVVVQRRAVHGGGECGGGGGVG